MLFEFKKMLMAAVVIPCLMFFAGCGNAVTVRSVEKTATEGLVDTYTITYSGGTTFDFTVTNGENGKDAEDLSFADAYAEAVKNGYTGSYMDFIVNFCSGADSAASVGKALSSAVSVYAEHPVTKIEYYYAQNPYGGIGLASREVKTLALSAGSGIIYKIAGESVYIVTNYHVVYNKNSNTENKIGRRINVYLYGSSDKPAAVTDESGKNEEDSDGYPVYGYGESAVECEYVGGSMVYDIAVLKADLSVFPSSEINAVEFADEMYVGDEVFAAGNPNAAGISVTGGMVSVDSEYIAMTAADEETIVTYRAIRTDTAINSGNSGGGLFNSQGKLIGLVNAKITSASIENIAYAIPASIVIGASENIIASAGNGSDKINKLALNASVVSEGGRAEYDKITGKIRIFERATVGEVSKSGFAAAAGLLEGDIITSVTVDGTEFEITRAFNVGDALFFAVKGSNVGFSVVRNGETEVLEAEALEKYFSIIA